MSLVFVTGSTGFMGRTLCRLILSRGHHVRALARAGSESRVVKDCQPVIGDPLDSTTYRNALKGVHTFVHLVGVAHPSPSKAAQFRAIDLRSATEAVAAAAAARVQHFVYVSVAQPAPIMREYIAARAKGEEAIRLAGLNATIVRPWYVLGPGRRWPLALLPIYWVLQALPPTRKGAQRLGLVTLNQMAATLASAVDHPAAGVRIVDVPGIRRGLNPL
jgi:uncharacterized protein YbjT (DUF2867 family)